MGDWVRNSDLQCAWLSLDRFDTQPARLFHGVVGAIQAAAGQLPLPGNDALMALDQSLAHDRAASYDLLLGALEQLTEPIVLVIDDLHLAGPELASGIVGVLAASAPPALRLVLSGRGHPSHPAGAAQVRGRPWARSVPPNSPLRGMKSPSLPLAGTGRGLRRRTALAADWRMAGRRPREPQPPWLRAGNVPGGIAEYSCPSNLPLADYIAEEVLDQLDPPLADFVLRATTCDWLGRRLAVELHGRPDGGMLLEACLRDGLFIEEHELPRR